eukprot:Blabericola_migrator_1__3007@NODE_1871_length_3620_cov_50_805235_g1156_i1_p2_GENE_NODE_1871_length_3620_cov_50_805235_g1156_i1NODE_1871_length_3620_cov_50_805235_g1156_i1_p2_ORF_typecomplete_len412_score61_25DNA_primase_S/PF01896_19/9_5e54nsp7/PF08716_10/1_5e02nsp7/PF08716_10/6_3_NODE_1871_length_3620_cov_50_805235_g1156_i1801315
MSSRFMKQQQLLALYYAHLCPFQELVEWLRPGTQRAAPLMHREFSISMQKEDGKEIYRRWLSFSTADDIKSEILRTKPIPHKFDIGAVYTKPVSAKDNVLNNDTPFRPIAREFVLDIDMNDYDNIRTCCEGKKVCKKCWRFLAIAAHLIDDTLKEDFGFKEVLWVFSGRRGIHCWVTDVDAKKLATSTRSAVASYMVAISSTRLTSSNVPLKGRYARRAVKVLSVMWPRILEEQNFFFHPSKGSSCLDQLKELLQGIFSSKAFDVEGIFKEIRNAHGIWGDSLKLWHKLSSILNDAKPSKPGDTHANDALDAIMVYFLQPKLDINVSKDMGHLLKSPFVIHQGTGKICCPLQLNEIDDFDPDQVPTVADLFPLDGTPKEPLPGEALEKFQGWVDSFKTFTSVQKQQRDFTG